MRSWTLTRQFLLLTLVLMVLASGVLTLSMHKHQVRQMEHLAQDRNVLTTQVLQNLLAEHVEALALLGQRAQPGELATHREVDDLRQVLAPLLRNSDIAKVKIYSPRGLTLFSTEAAQIGEDKSDNAGFQAALRGEVASELTHRDQFSAFDGVRSDLDLVSSYVPVHQAGQLVAVFELYQEVTNLVQDIKAARWHVMAWVGGALLSLFAFQWAAVQRAQAVLVAQEMQMKREAQRLGESVQAQSQALLDSQDRINHLSTHDQLTALPNRVLLFDRLQQALLASARHGGLGAVILIDLDHFSLVNDTAGHELGDGVLQAVALALQSGLREVDTVARFGSDEFAVVLTGQESLVTRAVPAVEQLAEKLLQLVRSSYWLPATGFQGSASLGITLFKGTETAGEELLQQAELAMHRSKAGGRNRITFFDPAMADQVLLRTRLETDMRRALRERELVLHYQPEIEAKSGRIVAAEALVRWQHPTRGLLPPGDFIQLAEDTGLIVPLGMWVIEAACVQLVAWRGRTGLEHIEVSVNVSVQQFCHPSFFSQVLEVLQRTGAEASRLKLELTESLFAEDLDQIVDTMQRLRTLGLSFSLDDFGTGYSSLSYLGRLPLDQLKVDKTFVQDIGRGEADLSVCAAIISLAHGLRLKVVAEGVETELQRYVLTHGQHCDLLQGYLISRPLPAAAFETFVLAGHAASTAPNSGIS